MTTRRTALGGLLAATAGWPAAGRAAVAWPDIELLDGPRIAAADWAGTAAVLVVFSTTCPFCRNHNAHVDRLHRATQGQPLRVIGAALDRDADAVRAYRRATGYAFPMTMAGEALRPLFTPRRVIPMTIAVGRDGRVHTPIPGEMFEADVMALARLAV